MAITPTGKGTQEVNYPTNKVAGYVLVGALALGAIKLLTHLVQKNSTPKTNITPKPLSPTQPEKSTPSDDAQNNPLRETEEQQPSSRPPLHPPTRTFEDKNQNFSTSDLPPAVPRTRSTRTLKPHQQTGSQSITAPPLD